MACAKTIHKAQGSTVKQIVLDLGSRKQEHMHYVGLSRVRKLQDLFILNLNENKIAVSEQVVMEMNRLRLEASLWACLPMLENLNSDVKIIYHNTRSLHLHYRDLQTENNMLSADIIVLAESRLKSSDKNEDYHLPGFSIQRFDSNVNHNNERPFYGIVVYSKLPLKNLKNLCLCGIETVVCSIEVKDEIFNLVFYYCSPRIATIVNFQLYVTSLFYMGLLNATQPFILMGDTNLDYFSHKDLKSLADPTGILLHQIVHSCTTDYGSCLDHIYTNRPVMNYSQGISSATLESFYSDHKPIVAYIPV